MALVAALERGLRKVDTEVCTPADDGVQAVVDVGEHALAEALRDEIHRPIDDRVSPPEPPLDEPARRREIVEADPAIRPPGPWRQNRIQRVGERRPHRHAGERADDWSAIRLVHGDPPARVVLALEWVDDRRHARRAAREQEVAHTRSGRRVRRAVVDERERTRGDLTRHAQPLSTNLGFLTKMLTLRVSFDLIVLAIDCGPGVIIRSIVVLRSKRR